MLFRSGGTALIANGLGQMLGAGLTVLAYEEYSSSRVAGALFAAFGAGAVIGSIVAVRVVGRFDPLRLGAAAFVALTVPIFALAVELPVPAVMVACAASSFFGPLVNAPLIGVITMRTPEALRAKVMTAVLTTAMLAGPVGLVVAGQQAIWMIPVRGAADRSAPIYEAKGIDRKSVV